MKTKRDKKFEELHNHIRQQYDHAIDESWWPKGRKRTQKWGIQQSAIIATLMKTLQVCDFLEAQ